MALGDALSNTKKLAPAIPTLTPLLEIEALTGVEADLGVPSGFLKSLYQADDWTFIIKLHALLEAAFTQALSAATDDRRMDNLFAALSFTDSRNGKIGAALQFNIIDKSVCPYLKWLSKLRNACVHDIRHLDLSLSEYLTRDSESELAALETAFSKFSFGNAISITRDLIRKGPKELILLGASATFVTLRIGGANANPRKFTEAVFKALAGSVT